MSRSSFSSQFQLNGHDETDMPNEQLVHKLQVALRDHRRNRDAAQRSMELEQERLRLIHEEEEALTKKVEGLQKKLAGLEEVSTKIGSELGPLEETVYLKTQAMKFQHAELLSARDKIQHLNVGHEQAVAQRAKTLQETHHLLCERREILIAMEANDETMDQVDDDEGLERQKEYLEREINGWMFEWGCISKLMEEQAGFIQAKAQELQEENDLLEEQCVVEEVSPMDMSYTEAPMETEIGGASSFSPPLVARNEPPAEDMDTSHAEIDRSMVVDAANEAPPYKTILPLTKPASPPIVAVETVQNFSQGDTVDRGSDYYYPVGTIQQQ